MSRPKFDPLRDATSAASDDDLIDYLRRRLGLRVRQIALMCSMLGSDGAAHEVWEELVARRRKDGR